jgi:ubiquinone/menaquinone biosynthesis C-methylase UbiE
MSHFNEQAATWDNENKIKMMRELAAKTMAALDLKKKMDIMDFGCGTGLLGLEFADHAKSLTGVDTSTEMLEVFCKKTKGHPEIKSVLVDLEHENLNETFDLIISSMAFHHLVHPENMLLKFKRMLNQGGKIAIIDLREEDGSFHPNPREMGVKHFGFSNEDLTKWAQASQMRLEQSTINEIQKNNTTYQQFLAIFS